MSVFKSVIVTGANRGLGLELVQQLASKSSCLSVIATCRDPDQAQTLLKIRDEHQDKVHVHKLELNDIDSYPDFLEEIKSQLDSLGVSCLINNAGVAPKATRYNLVKVEQMEQTFKTNVIAPLFLSRAFIPYLKESKDSVILNMSSSLGTVNFFQVQSQIRPCNSGLSEGAGAE